MQRPSIATGLLLPLLLSTFLAGMQPAASQSLETRFVNPPDSVKPLIIWQWMDGIVTEEGITADLEAYREAGLGGVQQFLVGGRSQTLICDTARAVGTPEWERLMAFAIRECDRLGLTFGTHNCPGWSSSAYPAVTPEHSMQKIVWSETPVTGRNGRAIDLLLPRPETPTGYYRDIAVIAVPDRDRVPAASVTLLSDRMRGDGSLRWKVPAGRWRVFRFGHTSNLKTNEATAPHGGVGLECDKMSREAVKRFWDAYPARLIELAGELAGKTFTRIEIDSYEAGGQEWTKAFPQEFLAANGYDILPWLPLAAGVAVGSDEESERVRSDWQRTVRALFAENYYGYLCELAHAHRGMKMLIEPYATGASKPFNPIDTERITATMGSDDIVCAEFWTQPGTWGWPEVPMVVDAARKSGHETVYAEGFTCWPLHAWKDDPDRLKVVGDRAFCLGINALMLHAGAHNPWVGARPGMSFGIWGTQWNPGQTWWQSGGAKELFGYFARCQALLQSGVYVDDFRSQEGSLTSTCDSLQWIHRREGGCDLYFLSNPTGKRVAGRITLKSAGRIPEIWHPETLSRQEAPAWRTRGGATDLAVTMNPGEAFFLVLRQPAADEGPGLERPAAETLSRCVPDGLWHISFSQNGEPPVDTAAVALFAWNESDNEAIRYFSGTASYRTVFTLGPIDPGSRYVLDLGDVRNLARLSINGKQAAHLWRPPFRADITPLVRAGENTLEVEVTNLWVNRLIGDEQQPDDVEWSEPVLFQNSPAGRFMKSVPDWLAHGAPRPSRGRKAVVSFKFFEKEDPLLPSGLLGPVSIEQVR